MSPVMPKNERNGGSIMVYNTLPGIAYYEAILFECYAEFRLKCDAIAF